MKKWVFPFSLILCALVCGFGLSATCGEADEESSASQSQRSIITNSIGMKMRLIPAGSFMMGSLENELYRKDNEGPQHKVTISEPFYLGVYEVTQEQYEKVMGENQSVFEDNRRPVENVSWNDAKEFCAKLTALEGNATYRLPTEAEWEYACRAGMPTVYYWGQVWNNDYGWCATNSDRETKSVGTKKPNRWGLFDMSGNVWEWCEDWYNSSEYPSSERTDPTGPTQGNTKVLRGGGWSLSASGCRSASRFNANPDMKSGAYGFRVVRVP